MMANKYEKLDICCDENSIEQGARQILKVVRPQWETEKIKIKQFTEGITNKLVGCYNIDEGFGVDVVLIRIYGANTELIIDRDTEKNNIVLLSDHGLCPPLYAVFNNGVAYGFCPGETLDCDSVKKYRVQIAKELVKLHSLKPTTGTCTTEPGLFPKLEKWLKIAPTSFDEPEKQKRFIKEVGSIDRLQKEYELLKETIESMNVPSVMSHNDLLLKNLIYDESTDCFLRGVIRNYEKKTLGLWVNFFNAFKWIKPEEFKYFAKILWNKYKPKLELMIGQISYQLNITQDKISFIDHEYAVFNYQPYDIGNHFCEYAGVDDVDFNRYPNKEYQLEWLRTYLEEWNKQNNISSSVTDEDVYKLYVQVNKCALAAHYFWGIWALIQAKYSKIDFDYLDYAIMKLNEYFARKEEFLSL